MTKTACLFCLSAWMCLQSAQAQSGPSASRSADNEVTASSTASLPSPATIAAKPSLSPRAQQFVCAVGIPVDNCRQEMAVLRKVLANYHSAELGQWNWVLVRSEHWKLLLIGRGFNSGVPALTALDARTTFFEEALISGPSGRLSELMDIWHVDRDALLDLAVRHELGHALCGEENERLADRAARLLEQKKPVTCEWKAKTKPKTNP